MLSCIRQLGAQTAAGRGPRTAIQARANGVDHEPRRRDARVDERCRLQQQRVASVAIAATARGCGQNVYSCALLLQLAPRGKQGKRGGAKNGAQDGPAIGDG
eukprot:5498203-Prymnesium_polylepis.2